MRDAMTRWLGCAVALVGTIVFVCALNCQAAQIGTFSSALTARGHGTVSVAGFAGTIEAQFQGFLVLSAADTVTVPDRTADPLVLKNGDHVYADIDGTVRLTGDDMSVVFGGSNIVLQCSGADVLVLTGSGYYRRGLAFGVWSAVGTPVDLSVP